MSGEQKKKSTRDETGEWSLGAFQIGISAELVARRKSLLTEKRISCHHSSLEAGICKYDVVESRKKEDRKTRFLHVREYF